MIWAVVAYRRRHANEVPEQTRYNIPIEALYTIVPLIMILGLFWFTARDQSEILTVENDQEQTVNVVGFRWSWGFNYLDEDVYDVGVPYGEGSPGEPPTLYLPVDEKIRFELTSPDPLLLGSRLLVQDGPHSRQDQRLRTDTGQDRYLRRQMRRVVRCRPFPHALPSRGR
jgi:hypothetical protein